MTDQRKINMAASLVRAGNRHINCVRFSTANSWKHEHVKAQVCFTLETMGQSYICEAIFNSGGRCDVYWLDQMVAIEIVMSEKKESIENKKKTYPAFVTLKVIDAKEEFNPNSLMIP